MCSRLPLFGLKKRILNNIELTRDPIWAWYKFVQDFALARTWYENVQEFAPAATRATIE